MKDSCIQNLILGYTMELIANFQNTYEINGDNITVT